MADKVEEVPKSTEKNQGWEINSLTLQTFLSAKAEQYPDDLLVFFIANHIVGDYIGKSKVNGSIDDFYSVYL